jgi:hypothetical protein
MVGNGMIGPMLDQATGIGTILPGTSTGPIEDIKTSKEMKAKIRIGINAAQVIKEKGKIIHQIRDGVDLDNEIIQVSTIPERDNMIINRQVMKALRLMVPRLG